MAQSEPTGWQARDRMIASQFAPMFHHALSGSGRFDYITNFDFDNDWVGDNNWKNAADPQFPLKGYVYYAVTETASHYYIHYAAFHPRDYKGGEVTGSLLSQAVRRGAKASKKVKPTTIADDVVLAHENDLEGCLVIVEKRGERLEDAQVIALETLAHNKYLKYQPEPRVGSGIKPFRLEGQRPLVFIESKGHGMEAYWNQAEELAARAAEAAAPQEPKEPANGFVGRIGGLVNNINKARRVVNNEGVERIRIYRFTGEAVDPDTVDGDIGYDLVPTYDTFWAKARGDAPDTFGNAQDYGTRTITVTANGKSVSREIKLGSLGSSFNGKEGAVNMARPPWGWFDMTERHQPLGQWFLDPAGVVARHFDEMKSVPVAYIHHPFFDVFRPASR